MSITVNQGFQAVSDGNTKVLGKTMPLDGDGTFIERAVSSDAVERAAVGDKDLDAFITTKCAFFKKLPSEQAENGQHS